MADHNYDDEIYDYAEADLVPPPKPVEKVTLGEAMAIVFACIAELKKRIETLEQLAEVNGYEPE